MASVGTASLRIIPKFDGLQVCVNKALAGVKTEPAGTKMGKGLSGGIGKGLKGLVSSGSAMGVFSSLTTKAMDVIGSHVGSAVSRLDTLKNYPVVMESLGYSARDTQKSIQTMSDRLNNLPTTLDSMSSTVQGLTAVIGDLDKATDVGLALNDMMLAGGQGAQVTGAAMEQFRQILAKGKPEMQDWKSLMSAAPGQMNELAQAMLGPTAKADDLYAALGGGKNDPTITMDQLMDKIVELDQKGGSGFKSFKDQAERATEGVATSAANAGNAVTKGLTSVMDAIGRENIAGAFNTLKNGINDTFKVITTQIVAAKPIVASIAEWTPGIVGASVAITGLGAATRGLKAAGIMGLGDVFAAGSLGAEALKSACGGLLASINPLAVAVTALVGVVAFAAVQAYAAEQKQKDFAKASDDMAKSAETAFASLKGGSKKVTDFAGDVHEAAMNTDQLTDAIKKHNEAMEGITKPAEETIGMLGQYKTVIDDLAGKHTATADETARLQWALDGLNSVADTSYTVEQVLSGEYKDQEGHIKNLRDEVDKLIESRQREAQMQAAQQGYTEALKNQTQMQHNLANAQKEYDDKIVEITKHYEEQGYTHERAAEIAKTVGIAQYEEAQNLRNAKDAYKDATDEVRAWSDEQREAYESTDTFKKYVSELAESLNGLDLGNSVASVDDFAKKLAEAGVSTEQLNAVGSENLKALAAECNGDMSLMTFFIQGYNSTPILNKDGKVSVERAQLMDAQGRVWTWNGSKLVDKNGIAAVEDLTLVDAYNNVVKWNGEELKKQKGTARVDANSVKKASGLIDNYNRNKPKNHHARTVIDIVRNTFNNIFNKKEGKSATGSVSSSAYIPRHADGYITNGATLTNNGWVGEDGREAVINWGTGGAVIPLTNHKYMQPIAEAIADNLTGVQVGGAIDYARLATSIVAAFVRAGIKVECDAREMGKLVRSYA
ncbi:MAG: tape measure protein [Coriobacteriaceae bacterium]|nr:tape measure protein [Coriobacteriaceae bacterium]